VGIQITAHRSVTRFVLYTSTKRCSATVPAAASSIPAVVSSDRPSRHSLGVTTLADIAHVTWPQGWLLRDPQQDNGTVAGMGPFDRSLLVPSWRHKFPGAHRVSTRAAKQAVASETSNPCDVTPVSSCRIIPCVSYI
jgi:hypothetical protein